MLQIGCVVAARKGVMNTAVRPGPNNEAPASAGQADMANARGRWDALLGRGLFETVIVAVGVLLALMVDEWRQSREQRQLADEARTALRAEILANREALIERMRTTSRIYAAATAEPAQVSQFVFERRNRPLLVNDSAWTMTVQTGAIRWLAPEERSVFARVYAGHDRMREVVAHELVRWTELAAFAPDSGAAETLRDRNRAIRVWQAFAQRAQFALCMNLARHEEALGALIPNQEVTRFCVRVPADRDPAMIYGEWKRRGWTSSSSPAILRRG